MTSILAISGSLRVGSLNTALLRAARARAPEGVDIAIAGLAGIPVYNGDDQDTGFPENVIALAESIRQADAVLIATPEYNYSIPGPLKNAIDWISRVENQPLSNKPVAIMGASPGRIGTARCQYHLRQVLVCLNAKVLNKPEVFVGGAGDLFDDNLNLTDEATGDIITRLVTALAAAA